MSRSDIKRLLKKNKPRVPVGSPEFDVSQLKALQRQATEKFTQELDQIKTNHEKLVAFVESAIGDAIDQIDLEIREEFQARLSETSSTFEMSLTTLEQNFEEHVEELHEELRKTNNALQKTVIALERKIEKTAKGIQCEIAKLRIGQ